MKVDSSSNLFALRALSASAKVSSPGRSTEAAADTSPAERIKAWQEARVDQPASRTSPRQAALEKAAILKRRLEMLKAMLLFASPEAAKSIASQLKGIAGELAALGKSLGDGGATLAASGAALPGGETVSAAATTEGDSDQAAAPASTEPTDAGDEEQTSNAGGSGDVASDNSGDDQAEPGASASKSDDSALRKAIADAKRLLKVLILRVKAKLQEGDAQARRDLQAAEKRLADLDSMTGTGLYTAFGGLAADAGAAELSLTPALTGASVDTNA